MAKFRVLFVNEKFDGFEYNIPLGKVEDALKKFGEVAGGYIVDAIVNVTDNMGDIAYGKYNCKDGTFSYKMCA